MNDSWEDPRFAETYRQNATDTDTNWYEHFVNLASLQSLIPEATRSMLDFGCGPGDFTAQLRTAGYELEGCDASKAMIRLAQDHYPEIEFFVWDGTTACPKTKQYDAVISKLTLHFVEDLDTLATQLLAVVRPKGTLLISVPHPVPTMSKAHGAYFQQVRYDTEIGAYGMHTTMIHRSIQGYITPFLDNGFVLTGIVEPVIPDTILKKYAVPEEYAKVPRRLNLRFEKASQ